MRLNISPSRIEQIYKKYAPCIEDLLYNFDLTYLSEDDAEGIDYYDSDIFSDCMSGASKIVLFPIDDEDIVIKIPLCYSSCEGEPFYAAPVPNGWDYCEAEAAMFEKAMDAGVDDFFAETIYIGDIFENYPIYIQPRCDANYDVSIPTAERKDRLRRCTSKYTCGSRVSTDVLNTLFTQCKASLFLKLLKFIRDAGVSDLHSGNFAADGNGRLVIIDYSGYNE